MRASTRRAALRGAGALTSASFAAKAISFGGQLALARVLFPADFGLYFIAAGIAAIASRLANFESRRDVLRCAEPDVLPRARAYFLVQLGLGLLVALVLACCGPAIAAILSASTLAPFDGDSALGAAPLITALAFFPVLEATRMPLVAVLERRMEFRFLAGLEVAGTTLQVATWFLLGWSGAGAWALIAGVYVASAVRSGCVTLRVFRDVGRVRARAVDFASLRSFGLRLWLMLLLATLFWIGKDVFAGALLGVSAAGFFGLAFEIPRAILHVAESWNRVGLAVLGQSDEARQRRVVDLSLRASAALLAPVAIVGITHPETVLELAFGSTWVVAAPVFRVFMVLAAFEACLRVWADIATTHGRPELPLRASAATALLFPVFAVFVTPFGIEGLAYAVLAAWLLPLPFCIAWAQRRVGVSFLRALRPAIVSAALSIAVGACVESLAGASIPEGSLLTLALELVVFYALISRADPELAGLARESFASRRLQRT